MKKQLVTRQDLRNNLISERAKVILCNRSRKDQDNNVVKGVLTRTPKREDRAEMGIAWYDGTISELPKTGEKILSIAYAILRPDQLISVGRVSYGVKIISQDPYWHSGGYISNPRSRKRLTGLLDSLGFKEKIHSATLAKLG